MINYEYLGTQDKIQIKYVIKTISCLILIPSKISKCPVYFLKRKKQKRKMGKGETLE